MEIVWGWVMGTQTPQSQARNISQLVFPSSYSPLHSLGGDKKPFTHTEIQKLA